MNSIRPKQLRCPPSFVAFRCRVFGVDPLAVEPCVIERGSDWCIVDVTHPAWPWRPSIRPARDLTEVILARYDHLVRETGPDGLPTRGELERRIAVCRSNPCGEFRGRGCGQRWGSLCRVTDRWFERLTVDTCKHWTARNGPQDKISKI